VESHKIIYEIKTGRKKEEDARILSERTNEIENKINNSIPLDKADFEYLFEVDNKIETFLGVSDYRRILYLRNKSEPENHLDTIFGCQKEQIAYTSEQITPDTKAWVGPITIDILAKLPDTTTHIHNKLPRLYSYGYHDQQLYEMQRFFRENYAKYLPDERKFVTLEKKIKNKEELNREELVSLYSVEENIYHFSAEGRLDLEKLRRGRDIEKDMLVVFGCEAEEVAHNISEINENTKAYVGSLEAGIFQKLPESVEYIYTRFPEFRIFRDKISIGEESGEQLLANLEDLNYQAIDRAKHHLKKLKANNKTQEMILVNLPAVAIVKSSDPYEFRASFQALLDKARSLGLELCPQNVAPYYVKNDKNNRYSHMRVCSEPFLYSENGQEYKELLTTNLWWTGYKGAVIGAASLMVNTEWERFLFKLSEKK
jgi:hypothetical protein